MMIDGVETLVGATSYGTTTCGMPWDVSARVDIYFDWITSYIAAHDPSAATDAGIVTQPDAVPSPNDAGAPEPPDAGLVDSGQLDASAPDASAPDAAVPLVDAGTTSDAAAPGERTDATAASDGVPLARGAGGCSCSVRDDQRPHADLAWLLVTAGLLRPGRRRAKR
jgi:MYXO-CTERM domain-containing protein